MAAKYPVVGFRVSSEIEAVYRQCANSSGLELSSWLRKTIEAQVKLQIGEKAFNEVYKHDRTDNSALDCLVGKEKEASREKIKPRSKAATIHAVEEVVKAHPVDFASALKMLAMLPLSDMERAQAVRRLLGEVSD